VRTPYSALDPEVLFLHGVYSAFSSFCNLSKQTKEMWDNKKKKIGQKMKKNKEKAKTP